MSTVLRVFAYLRRYPGMALAQLACAIGGTLMVVVFPAVTREVIDVIVPQEQWHRLTQVCLLALGVIVQDDLLLEEVEHQVSDPVGVLDLVGHGLVARLKLVQYVGIHLKIILAKDKGASLVSALILNSRMVRQGATLTFI
jgi:hypothetical protein